jgi:sugar lactone lactonase YvrE
MSIRTLFYTLLILIPVVYLLAWPVPIEPVSWFAPPNRGYEGVFYPNRDLAGLARLSLAGDHGPEDATLGPDGNVYVTTAEGNIVRLTPDGAPERWVSTGGRPLGLKFDAAGNLVVADAYRGLLSISPARKIKVLTDTADGIPIRYANNLDIAADGRVFFSDASTRFGARAFGGTYEASLLDLMEHGGHGRLLVYEPATGTTRTLLDGLQFANGVALADDDDFVLVAETGAYQITLYWLADSRAGQSEVLIDQLPGFPDNLTRGLDGTFWLGFASPRNKLLDEMAPQPLKRMLVQRLPTFLRPKAEHYGHVIAVDRAGHVVDDLQDPGGEYPITTGVLETADCLFITSLVAPYLGVKSREGRDCRFGEEGRVAR